MIKLWYNKSLLNNCLNKLFTQICTIIFIYSVVAICVCLPLELESYAIDTVHFHIYVILFSRKKKGGEGRESGKKSWLLIGVWVGINVARYFSLGRWCYQSSRGNKWNYARKEWADSKSGVCKKYPGPWIRNIRNFPIKQSCSCCYRGCDICPTGVLFLCIMNFVFVVYTCLKTLYYLRWILTISKSFYASLTLLLLVLSEDDYLSSNFLTWHLE